MDRHDDTPITKDSRDTSFDKQVCVSLYQATNRTARFYGRLLAPFGLTFSQFQVLIALFELGHCSVGKLCTVLDLETSTITPVLKRLEGNGLIVRFRDRVDERRVFVVLTTEGHTFEEKARSIRCQFVEHTGLSLAELGDLQRMLQRLSASLGRTSAAFAPA